MVTMVTTLENSPWIFLSSVFAVIAAGRRWRVPHVVILWAWWCCPLIDWRLRVGLVAPQPSLHFRSIFGGQACWWHSARRCFPGGPPSVQWVTLVMACGGPALRLRRGWGHGFLKPHLPVMFSRGAMRAGGTTATAGVGVGRAYLPTS